MTASIHDENIQGTRNLFKLEIDKASLDRKSDECYRRD